MSSGTSEVASPRRAQISPQSAQSPAPDTYLVISGGRTEEIVRFETEVVALFVDAAALLGVPKSIAAVYGIVFASPEPLSFSEISARLNFSNGSVSTGLKALRAMGAIRVAEASTHVPDARFAAARERFEPDTEMRRLLVHFLETRVETQLVTAQDRFDIFRQTLGSFSKSGQKVIRQRVKKLEDWHRKSRSLLPLVKTFLRLGA